MDRPNRCKWCGCGGIRAETDSAIHFKCFSSYWPQHDKWNISTNCSAACALLLLKERDRIRRALEKIKSSKRWSAERNAKTPIAYYVDPDGWIAQGSDLDDVARILEGDSDEHAE